MTLIIFFLIKHLLNYLQTNLEIYLTCNIPSFHNNLQHALDLLMLLSKIWQLPINISKTQLLHLGTFTNVNIYLINGINILPADKVLDIGIITDKNLNYSSHISSIISKARSRTGLTLKSFFRTLFLFSGKLTSRLFVL